VKIIFHILLLLLGIFVESGETHAVDRFEFQEICASEKSASGVKNCSSGLLTGKEWESETGTYYFGARRYDPTIGMWYGRDPAGQFESPYVYAGNEVNPVNSFDPDGELQVVQENESGEIKFEEMDSDVWGEGLLSIDENGVGMMMSTEDVNEVFSYYSGGYEGSLSILNPDDFSVFSIEAYSGKEGKAFPLPAGNYYFDTDKIQMQGLKDRMLGLLPGKHGAWPGGDIAWGSLRVWLKPATPYQSVSMMNAGRSPKTFTIHGGLFAGSAGCIDLLKNDLLYFSLINERSSGKHYLYSR
jgi:RHS repeat-associated protein